MQPGAVVEGLLVESVGSTRDGVTRATVRGPDGAPGELLWVAAPDPALRDRFLAGHRALAAQGVSSVRAVLEGPGLAAVHRAPTLDAPLERLSAPLPPAIVAGIGAEIARALRAAGPILGELRADDLGATPDGAPVLAPRLGRPPRPGGQPARDLARLLFRWWTGRTPGPGALPPAPADLDPRVEQALTALEAGDPDGAAAILTALAGGPIDLRPHLAGHPAGLAVRTTRAPEPDDAAIAPVPWRAAGWAAAVLVWLASALAALTVVLLPLAALGAAAGAALAAAGEVLARRALPGPRRPALADRTRGGKLTDGWDAVDTVRRTLAAARLPAVVEADVRTVVARWEEALTELAEAPPAELDARAPAAQKAVADEARRMTALIGRLATDDDAALSDLARWVHAHAP